MFYEQLGSFNMITSVLFRFYCFLAIFDGISGNSVNRPKFCPNATWNASAVTFATNTWVGLNPYGVFVNTNNTVFVANRQSDLIRVWSPGSTVPSRNISGGLTNPFAIFATRTDDIYVDNGGTNNRVDVWSVNSTISQPAMYVCGICYGLLVTVNNYLYCSLYTQHQVISQSLDNRVNVWTIVAGTGVAGSTSVALNSPRGIVLDENFNLFVADFINDRIQMFPFGQLNGTTVVASTVPGTFSLYNPSSVILDADRYLFISDTYNHRIIGSGPYGYRCVAGCIGVGSTADRLYYPMSISFDTFGNLYVADWTNDRIQRFMLRSNSCGNTTATTMATTTNANQATTASIPISQANAVSYNQPKFSALASWSGNAITFATSPTVGGTPYGLFVDRNNTVYLADRANNRIQMWLEGRTVPTRTITGGLSSPFSIFATNNGDIYVDNGLTNKRVDKWMTNGTRNSSAMSVKDECYGLFIDIENSLYCSMYTLHQVIMKSLDSNSNMWIIAAGTDCVGSTSNTLRNPRGIFVDTDLNLFVADCGNDRVQKFLPRQVSGVTVAGSGASGTITLNCPSGIVLDGDGYLFIVDSINHRIVASSPNGFRCIVGCSTVPGASSSQFNNPSDMKFDSYGNIFVLDRDNARIQKFILISNITYPVAIVTPNFCPSVTWYPDGITFANVTTVGVEPYGIFINQNNTIYVANRQRDLIQIWFEGNTNPSISLSGGMSGPLSPFFTYVNDLYIDNGVNVDKWSISGNSSVPVMAASARCYYLFVDISNTLYCSLTYDHRVGKKWLFHNETTITTVAGTGAAGSSASTLYYSMGIYVDVNFNLYVGDCGNDRVQMFPLGQMSGITIAGNGAPGTGTIDCPAAITFDANGYLYVGEYYGHRILGSGPYGFRCIAGCVNPGGSGSRQLNIPHQFSFDTYGNFYVADRINDRIQKFVLASNSCSLSYNQPKLCAESTWATTAATLASSAVIGPLPFAIFVDGINNIYAPSRASNAILVWSQWGTQIRSIPSNFNRSFSVFVSINGDVYFDNGMANGQVSRSPLNSSTALAVMHVNGSCYGLFIDLNNYLYCSLKALHQVVKLLLDNGTTIPTLAAGTGSPGSALNMLDSQQGIYVDSYANLYIADCGNNRIQLYQSGQTNGMTVAGTGALGTISLNCPTGVVLDSDGYLYIVDSNNHRIVGSSFTGYRCVAGCSGGGTSLSQLSFPQTMVFDSYGNMHVTDRNNSRIQIFTLQQTNCSTPSTVQSTAALTTSAVQTTQSLTTSQMRTTTPLTTSPTETSRPITISSMETTQPLTTSQMRTTTPLTTGPTETSGPITISSMETTQPLIASHVESTTPLTTTFMEPRQPLTSSHMETTERLTTSPMEITQRLTTGPVETTQPLTTNPLETTQPLTTAPLQTTQPQTTNPLETTQPLTTAPLQTTQPQTTSPVETTQPLTTAPLQTTQRLTTSPVETTQPLTTAPLQTTQRLTTSPLETTQPLTTAPLVTTQPLTTSPVETTPPLTTSHMETIKLVTTSPMETTLMLTTSPIETTSITPTTQQNIEQDSTTPTTAPPFITTEDLNQTCYSPLITLIPGGSTLTSPLQFRRSQDFEISSMIELRCDVSLLTSAQWNIKNCTSTLCSYQINLPAKINTKSSELYVPSRSLVFGLYELTLTVTMTDVPTRKSSSSVYVRITATGITANLVQLGTSMITRGSEQDLFLDPGTFSVDPDEDSFDATKWKYEYYCRIHGVYNFPNIRGILLPLNDIRVDPLNPSCLWDQSAAGSNLIYGNLSTSPKSSLTVRGGSLRSNQTYQFMVNLENRKNASIQATGYVLVTIEPTQPQLVAIGCVISVMCVPNLELQLVNPTTQVALFAVCIGRCVDIQSIQWNVYQGSDNASNQTQWTLFNQIIPYENLWFFGRQTPNFTASNQLFLNNPQINLWRFEVVYTFSTETSTSALNFIINQPPYNGSCVINPSNGTTTTLFTVSCPDWFDLDGIKDYTLYAWKSHISERIMVAFSRVSTFTIRLPAGNEQDSSLHVMIYIRDTLDCVQEVNIPSMIVSLDSQELNNFIDIFQTSPTALTKNPLARLLYGGNQNVIGQVLTSLSQDLNRINDENINNTISNGIPSTSISVQPLGSQPSTQSSTPFNESVLIEFIKALNTQASIRDYLIPFLCNLQITTMNSVLLQSSTFVQITETTNQLTRTAATLTAEKCYQLALALYSLTEKVSFEDVQTAAKQLTQCASNIRTAINGALQNRMIVLDLDLSRANTIPIDYDTDLESSWSKTNSLSDLDRNLYYQNQAAQLINTRADQISSLITSALNIHLNINQQYVINTSEVILQTQIRSSESLANQMIELFENARFEIPSNFTSNLPANSSIILRSSIEPLATKGNSPSQSNTNMSTSIALSIFDRDGNERSFQTDAIRIIIPRDPNVIIPSMNTQNVTSENSTAHNLVFYLHYVNISSVLPISVHIEMFPFDSTLAYLFIYKFDQIPQLNSSVHLIDGWTVFCPSYLTADNLYRYFLNNHQTLDHHSLIFGLRELNLDEQSQYCSNSSTLTQLPVTDDQFNFTSDYQLRLYTSGCYYLDGENHYRSDGLIVGSMTNHYQTECYSNHLTTFAGGFLVLPSPINWNYVFANLDFMRNKTIYLTVIGISLFYVILLIYARRKDRQDLLKLGIIPLSDNQTNDRYFYQILIFTGQRFHAGTKSKVFLILSGDRDQTTARRLEDPHRQIFQRGGIDSFILSVPKSLGLLNYIRIWHDNSGKGSSASWFLKYIIIRDLQTMDKSYFISQRWFAVEEEDGLIERILPVANDVEKQEFSYLLSKKTYHSVSDGHLWFSIFSRPPSTRFTRVQRCTCCFVLLFTSMLCNIMYYDLSIQSKSSGATQSNSLAIGPLYISAQQISIGIMMQLLSLIPSIFVVQLFRRIRPRDQTSPLEKALKTIHPSSRIAIKSIQTAKKRLGLLTFPWWCLFFAYTLSFLIMGVSIFFIFVRGIEFGDLKSQQWLTSIVTGVFSSVLLTEPIKIVSLVLFFACFCRKSNNIGEESELLDDDRMEIDVISCSKNSAYVYRASKSVDRLNECELDYAREQRVKEVQMWSIIRQMIIYVIFFILITLITFTNREANSFEQTKHLRRYFLNTRQVDQDYTKITTVNEYWEWLEGSFVGNLRAQSWYNGEGPVNLNGYLNDRSNRLIGWASMRQLRVNMKSCSDQRLISQCENDYNLFNEEKQSFSPGWTNESDSNEYNSAIIKSFQYQSSENLDSNIYFGEHAIYSGNGYVYEFRGSLSTMKRNLNELHRLGWIDQNTRAVLIQMTLYNPNVRLFTSVIILAEFLATGGVFTSIRIEPLDFYVFSSIMQLVCTIIYMCLIIYMMFQEIHLFIQLKRKYFREVWSMINLGLIICSWASVGIYIWRYQESSRIGKLFQQTNGFVYINIRQAVYINDILTYLQGFCCFFAMIRFVHLCRIETRLLLFVQTLSNARRELQSFAMMFSIIFMAFICLFYLLFVSRMWSCSNLLSTAQMLFEVTLMKFDTKELLDADAVLGPVCFTIFIFIVVFICLSMFLTIINENFRRAHAERKDEEMIGLMMKKFGRWTGLKRQTREEIQEEWDSRMRSQYFHPIENFPDKIDQLLEAMTKMFNNQKAELARLEKYEIEASAFEENSTNEKDNLTHA